MGELGEGEQNVLFHFLYFYDCEINGSQDLRLNGNCSVSLEERDTTALEMAHVNKLCGFPKQVLSGLTWPAAQMAG